MTCWNFIIFIILSKYFKWAFCNEKTVFCGFVWTRTRLDFRAHCAKRNSVNIDVVVPSSSPDSVRLPQSQAGGGAPLASVGGAAHRSDPQPVREHAPRQEVPADHHGVVGLLASLEFSLTGVDHKSHNCGHSLSHEVKWSRDLAGHIRWHVNTKKVFPWHFCNVLQYWDTWINQKASKPFNCFFPLPVLFCNIEVLCNSTGLDLHHFWEAFILPIRARNMTEVHSHCTDYTQFSKIPFTNLVVHLVVLLLCNETHEALTIINLTNLGCSFKVFSLFSLY